MPQQSYSYSYSGADSQIFVWFPRLPSLITELNSVHTLSISVRESKGQARAIGYRSIKGYAKSLRVIAGSLVMTVVEDHPFREMMQNAMTYWKQFGTDSWSVDRYIQGVGRAIDQFDFENQLPTMLPPFNLLMLQVAEGGAYTVTTESGDKGIPFAQLNYTGAATLLESVELIDDTSTTSISDIITQQPFTFIAKNYRPLSLNSLKTVAKNQLTIDELAKLYENDNLNKHSNLMQRLYPGPGPLPMSKTPPDNPLPPIDFSQLNDEDDAAFEEAGL